ncbi:hypothetical protein NS228_26030, partial [Methylobacterium indicum]
MCVFSARPDLTGCLIVEVPDERPQVLPGRGSPHRRRRSGLRPGRLALQQFRLAGRRPARRRAARDGCSRRRPGHA